MQFGAAVSEAPEGFSGPFPFVPLFRYRDGETFFLNNRYQNQVIVLNSGDEARIIALKVLPPNSTTLRRRQKRY
jgi:hypothetical protein